MLEEALLITEARVRLLTTQLQTVEPKQFLAL